MFDVFVEIIRNNDVSILKVVIILCFLILLIFFLTTRKFIFSIIFKKIQNNNNRKIDIEILNNHTLFSFLFNAIDNDIELKIISNSDIADTKEALELAGRIYLTMKFQIYFDGIKKLNNSELKNNNKLISENIKKYFVELNKLCVEELRNLKLPEIFLNRFEETYHAHTKKDFTSILDRMLLLNRDKIDNLHDINTILIFVFVNSFREMNCCINLENGKMRKQIIDWYNNIEFEHKHELLEHIKKI